LIHKKMGKFAGSWKRTKTEGGEAFFKVRFTKLGIGLKINFRLSTLLRTSSSELLPLTSSLRSNPTARTSSSPELTLLLGKFINKIPNFINSSESKSSTTKVTVGQESEITGPMGGTHKVTVEADGEAVVCKTTDGSMSIRFEVVNDELVETFSAKGNTFKRWHARA